MTILLTILLLGHYKPHPPAPHKQHMPVKHRIYLVLHGIVTPCPSVMADGSVNGGCSGGAGDTLAPLSPVDPNLVENARENPTACDSSNLDGDDSDDLCPKPGDDDGPGVK